MRAGRALRRIIINRIIDAVPDVGGRVFAKAAPENATYPYCTIGPSYWTDTSVECIKARAQVVQVNIWHRAGADGEAEDLVDDSAAALDGFADTDALTMHPLRVTLARVMDDPSGALHGVVQVEAALEA